MAEAMGEIEGAMRLPPVLDLAAAEGFQASILQQVQAGKALRLDASGVETLTVPCMQIILSAGRTYDVAVVTPSDAFTSAFRDVGLDWPQDGESVEGGEGAEHREGAEAAVAAPPAEALAEPVEPPAPMPEPVAASVSVEALVEVEAAMPEPLSEPVVEPAQAQDQAQESVQAELVQVQSVQAPDAAHVAKSIQVQAPPLQALDPVEDPAPEPTPSSDQGLAAAPAQDEFQHQAPAQMEETAMAKRIMTIDDSRTIRDMLMLTLTDAGYEVMQGVDGQDGLEVLGDQQVDVVITDINMPRMDGYEVIRRLRKSPVHRVTPILVLTTESDKDKKMLARDAGATGWMVKPFDPENLLATIRKVCP